MVVSVEVKKSQRNGVLFIGRSRSIAIASYKHSTLKDFGKSVVSHASSFTNDDMLFDSSSSHQHMTIDGLQVYDDGVAPHLWYLFAYIKAFLFIKEISNHFSLHWLLLMPSMKVLVKGC